MTVSGQRGSSLLPPFPDGWYAIAWSDEIGPGAVATRQFVGREVVVFRTESGVPSLMLAHCPHLGAHLGMGGRIVGESIRCPFHGFCFDEAGNCTATGYGTPVPAGLRARTWPVVETDGAIFAWHHHDDQPPLWELPESGFEGSAKLRHRTFQLKDHPQETTENSVDLGHFAVVHGYEDVALLKEVVTDGPYLNVSYRARRPLRPLGRFGPSATTGFEYDIHIYGLGYSQVDVSIPGLGLRARLLVLATPRADGEVDLRLGLRLHDPVDRRGLLRLLPARVIGWGAGRFVLNGFANDAAQDFPIWENKAYVSPPKLAKGDGPIGLYRKWASQFYPAG